MIQLIQITDCHLVAPQSQKHKGHDTLGSLRRVCRHIQQHAGQDTRLLLLTGDLSQDGSAGSYKALQAVIAELNIPAFALPGNHDDFAMMQRVFDPDIICCEPVITLAEWRILLLNSVIPGQVGGGLSTAELDALQVYLSMDIERPVLLALHHHPLPIGSAWMDKIGLAGAERLFSILSAAPQVKAVINGHVHQVFEQIVNGVRFISTPSSCYQFKPGSAEFALDDKPPGYRVLTLQPDGELTTYIERVVMA